MLGFGWRFGVGMHCSTLVQLQPMHPSVVLLLFKTDLNPKPKTLDVAPFCCCPVVATMVDSAALLLCVSRCCLMPFSGHEALNPEPSTLNFQAR